MSTLLARIMLAILMMPLAALVYAGTAVLTEKNVRDDTWIFINSTLATGLFVGGYWILLWRSTVRWTSRRVILTFASIVGAGAIGLAVGGLGAMVDPDFGVFIGGITLIVVWLTASVLVFRENKHERIARLRQGGADAIMCVACGYNMTGLHQTICPECGARYTLNELLASQPAHEQEQIGEAAETVGAA